jgi:hypothetical protein
VPSHRRIARWRASALDNDAGVQNLVPFGTVHGYFAKDK